MSKTTVRNISGTPFALPAPYSGMLPGGEAAVISDTVANIIASLGGLEFINGALELEDAPSGAPVTIHNSTAPINTRVALVTPDTATIRDGEVIVKLTAPGAAAVTLPASAPTGMVVEVIDGTGDAGSNNITVTPAAGTINGGASMIIATNYGRARFVRSPSEWLGVLVAPAGAPTGTAGGDLTGSYPNPTIGANKVTVAKLALIVAGAAQSLSGPGAVDVTHRTTKLTSTGVADALTLANSTIVGQRKTIIHAVDGGSMVLTPTALAIYTNITFTAVRDWVEIEWNGAAWDVVAFGGVTFA